MEITSATFVASAKVSSFATRLPATTETENGATTVVPVILKVTVSTASSNCVVRRST